MKYKLSKILPVPMRSQYHVCLNDAGWERRDDRWWQWRDRIFAFRRAA